MEIFNVLASADIWLYGTTYDIALNWIGELIRLLIIGVGSVGIGVILFSIILKVIVLPFDVYQRIGMRKQNQKMKENQAKMEKLQKQYANNKEMYNQKVMEMYKESGISPCSSCLPMILSMVIFFVAIGAFNSYSQFSNIQNYNTMVRAYNTELTQYCADVTPSLDDTNLQYTVIAEEVGKDAEGNAITEARIQVRDTSAEKYIYYVVKKSENFNANSVTQADIDYITTAQKYFRVDIEKAENSTTLDGLTEKITAALEKAEADKKDEAEAQAVSDYFISKAQNAVVKAYNDTVLPNASFLWIQNIWATDAAYVAPILEYDKFKEQVTQEKFRVGDKEVEYSKIGQYTNGNNPYDSLAYGHVTGALKTQKNTPNGYFILIALSIGTILLQQFVMMRSQKEQQKYSSVDGQGESQQKMMLIIMTAMFAIFSFMYSSAFSIYMIMSNVLSLLSTLIINKIVDTVQNKKDEKAFRAKYEKLGGKVEVKKSDKKDKK